METYQVTHEIRVPVDGIDLYQWLTHVSDKEYQRFAPAHRAMGLFKQEDSEGIVNVESIGGHLLVQHYLIKTAERDHLLMYSEKTLLYLFHLIPINIAVQWQLKVAKSTAGTSLFTCEVGVIYPFNLLKWASLLLATPYFLQRHTRIEGVNFAKDIEKKFSEGSSQKTENTVAYS